MTSKLSATAASFSQATSPATAFYINPILYPVTYYGSHQDRTMTYPSADNRVSKFLIENQTQNSIFSRITEMVLHMVVIIEIIIIINNNVHITIPQGIRNSNVDHNCSNFILFFTQTHTHIYIH